MSMLEVRDVTSGYEGIQVLRGVSLDVHEGEIIALFGPNGHGKSTLLKAIAGIHPATGGEIRFLGGPITHLPAHRIVELGIAYIAEERHLFTDMTVRENLMLGAHTRGARRRWAENLRLVHEVFPVLEERGDQLCSTLSGGEGRMVAIARGLMSDAKLLLVDEPSIGLAPGLKQTLYGALERISREGGITMLLVEQEIEHAMRLADRIYLLSKGAIRFERTGSQARVAEIKEAYF